MQLPLPLPYRPVHVIAFHSAAAFSGSNWIFLSKNYFLRFDCFFLFFCFLSLLWLCSNHFHHRIGFVQPGNRLRSMRRFENQENELNWKCVHARAQFSASKLSRELRTKQKPHNGNAAKHKSEIGWGEMTAIDDGGNGNSGDGDSDDDDQIPFNFILNVFLGTIIV